MATREQMRQLRIAVWQEHRRWGKGWVFLEAPCEGNHGGAEDGNEVKLRTQHPVLQIAGVVPVRSVKHRMSYSCFQPNTVLVDANYL